MIQNVERTKWDNTPNIHNVESNKGRMGQNIEWDTMLNRNNIEWDKILNRNNVEWDKKSNDKMSNRTKCRIVNNVEYRLFQMFVSVVCC